MRSRALVLASLISATLVGCSAFQASKEGPPSWMEQDCGTLPKMQTGKAKQNKVESTMSSDAVKFRQCRSRHRALRDWYRVRDGR